MDLERVIFEESDDLTPLIEANNFQKLLKEKNKK